MQKTFMITKLVYCLFFFTLESCQLTGVIKCFVCIIFVNKSEIEFFYKSVIQAESSGNLEAAQYFHKNGMAKMHDAIIIRYFRVYVCPRNVTTYF